MKPPSTSPPPLTSNQKKSTFYHQKLSPLFPSRNTASTFTQRTLIILFLLFLFLAGVKTLEESFKILSSRFVQELFNSTSSHPVLALFTGMITTALIQSSSATTSIIVGLVSSGILPLTGAIPMIMGANIGTSVTNTLISLAYVKNSKHFANAFASATIHDLFNFLTVFALLPLEIMTGFLEKASVKIAVFLSGPVTPESVTKGFSSPVKMLINPVVENLKVLFLHRLEFSHTVTGYLLIALSVVLVVSSLSLIVRTMKKVVESQKSEILENLLTKNPLFAIFFGIIMTISVQSSSITTSLLIPLAGSGILTPQSIFPVTIGANLGTTATGLFAALTGNIFGLSIALVHFLFNLMGTLIWYTPPVTRKLPLYLSITLGKCVEKKKILAPLYIFILFFAVPLLFIFI
jgi:sodium-dependent phosphate cotransporter